MDILTPRMQWSTDIRHVGYLIYDGAECMLVVYWFVSGPLAEPAPRHLAESAESAETYNVTDQKRQKDPAHRSTRCIQFVSKGFSQCNDAVFINSLFLNNRSSEEI